MKYITLNAIKAYIPSAVREHVDNEAIIDFLAFNALRMITDDAEKYDYGVCIAPVKNHTGNLPDNFVSIVEGVYNSVNDFSKYSGTTFGERVYEVLNEKKLFIGQAFIYPEIIKSKDLCPLRYVPMGKEIVGNDCIDGLCDYDCVVDYYVDKEGSFFRISEEEGYVAFLYKKYPENDCGEVLIPDDIDLIYAIAYYVTARILEERALMKEEGMFQLAQLYVQKADTHHRKYKRGLKLRRFNPDNYERHNITRLLGPALLYYKYRFD